MKLSIKGKNIIDGINENIIKDKVIRINHGHIQEIVNISDFVPDKDEKVYEYQDEIIMPGMIDVHVHLAYSGITSKRAFRAESADLDYTEQALRGYSFALQHMQYGFTSLRDMNAPGRVAISIRNLIDNNNLSGPTIKACGLGLSVTGGHMDQPGWGSHTNFNDMTYPCDGPHEFRKGVRTQFKLGADFIKTNICVSSISDKTKPYRQEMTDDEIETVCSEARLLNLKVASHTSGGRGITVGVKNGLHTVEHGHWLDNETVDLMAKNKTFYVPTLLINEVSSEMSKEEIGASKSSLTWLQLAREAKWNSLNKAIKANINIAVGTDAGFMLPHGSMNHKEMILLKKGGLNNMQVIKSATQIGAKLLEINAGVIEPGREADILIIKGNPLEDLNVLSDKNNIKVFKKGKLIKN